MAVPIPGRMPAENAAPIARPSTKLCTDSPAQLRVEYNESGMSLFEQKGGVSELKGGTEYTPAKTIHPTGRICCSWCSRDARRWLSWSWLGDLEERNAFIWAD